MKKIKKQVYQILQGESLAIEDLKKIALLLPGVDVIYNRRRRASNKHP